MKTFIKLMCLLVMLMAAASMSIAQSTHSGCAPKSSDKEWYTSGKKAPLFSGLAGIDFPVSTSSKEAQLYFNQGLMLSYAFNHAEAARSFYEAIRLDSNCAMCYWGYALVLGPNYNAGMEDDNIKRAFDASRKAIQHMESATPKEQMLILALAQRYDSVVSDSRKFEDEAYAEAMRAAYMIYPEDADVGTLFAESLMNLHPWDLYEKSGKEKAWTGEIVETLEAVLRRYPKHAGANHFYIHAVEASDRPERGLPHAKLLEDLVPGAGHLVHMPSHIYIRTGHYHEGSLANQRAVQVDSSYVEACHAQGVYPLAYYPHNYHFLAATATLEGNKNWALSASTTMKDLLDPTLLTDPKWGTLQHYYTIPYFVMVKFAQWKKLKDAPVPSKELVYPRAILEYAKGMAALGQKDTLTAFIHLNNLKSLAADPAIKAITIWDINSAGDILSIASHVLEGEYLLRTGEYEEAVRHLIEAIRIEDALNYNEPPDWFFSVRHYLGEAYLQLSIPHEAERVYREDLRNYPMNGWALSGLRQALEAQGKTEEAVKAEKDFQEAWKHADTPLNGSVIW